MNLLKSNYMSFFLVYFIISLINTFIILYIPVFMLIVLNVNRVELAFVQFLSYLTLFFGPLTGFLFDKYSRKKKKVIVISSVLLLFSFTFFNLNVDNLSFFGLFLALNFTSRIVIKAGMSKLMLETSQKRNVKKNIILIFNISTSFGSIVPIIIFNTLVINIYSIDLWTLFFNVCWMMSCPILFIVFLLKDHSTYSDIRQNNEFLEPVIRNNIPSNRIGLILIFLTNFLIWGDKLLEFPLTTWILTKFGEDGFLNYSYFFFVFVYLNMGGWLISRRLINQKKSKSYFSISIVIYGSILFLVINTDLIQFLLLMSANQIISGIMMSQLAERNIDISKLSKNSALSYELIRGSSLLAGLIFVPLGTLLSSFISIDLLITIVVLMSLLSLTPFILLKV